MDRGKGVPNDESQARVVAGRENVIIFPVRRRFVTAVAEPTGPRLPDWWPKTTQEIEEVDDLLRTQVEGQARLSGDVGRLQGAVESIAARQDRHEVVTGRLEEKITALDRKQAETAERIAGQLSEITALVNQARGAGWAAARMANLGWIGVGVAATAIWTLAKTYHWFGL